jgi:hypothetical protein
MAKGVKVSPTEKIATQINSLIEWKKGAFLGSILKNPLFRDVIPKKWLYKQTSKDP